MTKAKFAAHIFAALVVLVVEHGQAAGDRAGERVGPS